MLRRMRFSFFLAWARLLLLAALLAVAVDSSMLMSVNDHTLLQVRTEIAVQVMLRNEPNKQNEENLMNGAQEEHAAWTEQRQWSVSVDEFRVPAAHTAPQKDAAEDLYWLQLQLEREMELQWHLHSHYSPQQSSSLWWNATGAAQFVIPPSPHQQQQSSAISSSSMTVVVALWEVHSATSVTGKQKRHLLARRLAHVGGGGAGGDRNVVTVELKAHTQAAVPETTGGLAPPNDKKPRRRYMTDTAAVLWACLTAALQYGLGILGAAFLVVAALVVRHDAPYEEEFHEAAQEEEDHVEDEQDDGFSCEEDDDDDDDDENEEGHFQPHQHCHPYSSTAQQQQHEWRHVPRNLDDSNSSSEDEDLAPPKMNRRLIRAEDDHSNDFWQSMERLTVSHRDASQTPTDSFFASPTLNLQQQQQPQRLHFSSPTFSTLAPGTQQPLNIAATTDAMVDATRRRIAGKSVTAGAGASTQAAEPVPEPETIDATATAASTNHDEGRTFSETAAAAIFTTKPAASAPEPESIATKATAAATNQEGGGTLSAAAAEITYREPAVLAPEPVTTACPATSAAANQDNGETLPETAAAETTSTKPADPASGLETTAGSASTNPTNHESGEGRLSETAAAAAAETTPNESADPVLETIATTSTPSKHDGSASEPETSTQTDRAVATSTSQEGGRTLAGSNVTITSNDPAAPATEAEAETIANKAAAGSAAMRGPEIIATTAAAGSISTVTGTGSTPDDGGDEAAAAAHTKPMVAPEECMNSANSTSTTVHGRASSTASTKGENAGANVVNEGEKAVGMDARLGTVSVMATEAFCDLETRESDGAPGGDKFVTGWLPTDCELAVDEKRGSAAEGETASDDQDKSGLSLPTCTVCEEREGSSLPVDCETETTTVVQAQSDIQPGNTAEPKQAGPSPTRTDDEPGQQDETGRGTKRDRSSYENRPDPSSEEKEPLGQEQQQQIVGESWTVAPSVTATNGITKTITSPTTHQHVGSKLKIRKIECGAEQQQNEGASATVQPPDTAAAFTEGVTGILPSVGTRDADAKQTTGVAGEDDRGNASLANDEASNGKSRPPTVPIAGHTPRQNDGQNLQQPRKTNWLQNLAALPKSGRKSGKSPASQSKNDEADFPSPDASYVSTLPPDSHCSDEEEDAADATVESVTPRANPGKPSASRSLSKNADFSLAASAASNAKDVSNTAASLQDQELDLDVQDTSGRVLRSRRAAACPAGASSSRDSKHTGGTELDEFDFDAHEKNENAAAEEAAAIQTVSRVLRSQRHASSRPTRDFSKKRSTGLSPAASAKQQKSSSGDPTPPRKPQSKRAMVDLTSPTVDSTTLKITPGTATNGTTQFPKENHEKSCPKERTDYVEANDSAASRQCGLSFRSPAASIGTIPGDDDDDDGEYCVMLGSGPQPLPEVAISARLLLASEVVKDENDWKFDGKDPESLARKRKKKKKRKVPSSVAVPTAAQQRSAVMFSFGATSRADSKKPRIETATDDDAPSRSSSTTASLRSKTASAATTASRGSDRSTKQQQSRSKYPFKSTKSAANKGRGASTKQAPSNATKNSVLFVKE